LLLDDLTPVVRTRQLWSRQDRIHCTFSSPIGLFECKASLVDRADTICRIAMGSLTTSRGSPTALLCNKSRARSKGQRPKLSSSLWVSLLKESRRQDRATSGKPR
jgi:hypothetical protein